VAYIYVRIIVHLLASVSRQSDMFAVCSPHEVDILVAVARTRCGTGALRTAAPAPQ